MKKNPPAPPLGNQRAKGNKGGRPTKFKKEYTKKMLDFFSVEPYKQEIAESTKEYFADGKLKRESNKVRLTPSSLPTIRKFAEKIKVAYFTVKRWAEKGEDRDTIDEDTKKFTKEELEERAQLALDLREFSESYKEAKEMQKEFLISIGLSGATPPASFIFVAKNITDMKDKIEGGFNFSFSKDKLKDYD